MKIRYDRAAVKAIERMDATMKRRIRNAINGLLEIPPRGDISPCRVFMMNGSACA